MSNKAKAVINALRWGDKLKVGDEMWLVRLPAKRHRIHCSQLPRPEGRSLTLKVKRKRDWGRCYRKAGFKEVGKTKGGLIVLQLLPEEMPPQAEPMGVQQRLAF